MWKWLKCLLSNLTTVTALLLAIDKVLDIITKIHNLKGKKTVNKKKAKKRHRNR